MRKSVIFGVGFAIATACAVELGAQSAQSTTSSTASQNGTVKISGCLQRADQSRMGAAAATGTSGSAATTTAGSSSSAASDESFVLINAHMGGGMTSGSSGANGQSGQGISSGATSSGSTRGSNGGAAVDNSRRTMPYGTSGPWFIVNGDQDKLRSGVDHQVEVEGVIEQSASAAGTSGTAAPAATGTAGSASTTTSGTSTTTSGATSPGVSSSSASSPHMGEHLRVTSIRVINPTCSE